MADTHVVTNQVPQLEDFNPASSPVLTDALIREGGEWGVDEVAELGALSGSAQAQRWGELADRNQPILHTHDRYGHRVDEVEYDPAYHELMKVAIGHGLHAAPWADDRPGAHVVRAAKTSVWTPEPGHICPISMTYAVVPALRFNKELADIYEPLLTSRSYDPELKVPATKVGITAGMSMTEKQGGSDVRAGTTQATPNADGSYSLTGHKWFTSAPMCDVFLVLAQAPGGLSCFFLPRILPDGSRNRMFLQRLKEKLGNHANASSEVEYDGATAWLVGEEGRGVPTIIEMVNLTRLDCTLGSATSMRTGLTRAIHHAQHRKAFGAYLIDQPLMRNVLADLAVEAEAATIVAMRMAGATDRAVRGDERESLFRRIGLAASKYWVCKRATGHAAEAMECLGGNGYVEESGMPRLYREAPLMGIWEGSGNVSALDTLRAMATRPESIDVLFDELAKSTGQDPRLDAHIDGLKPQFDDLESIQYRARKVTEDIALALQGSLLVRHGHPAVAEAFLATRMGGQWGGAYGTMPAGLDLAPILERVLVKGMTHAIRPVDFDNLKTMTYEVTDRVARITFNRPEKGNAIIADTPLELSALVERADLDPDVHVILVSGRGEGFCAGFDLSAYAEGSSSAGGGNPYANTVLSGKTQAINHLPDQPWDPMIDYQMMSRFVRGFSSLMHCDKPTVVKIHGYCVAGGTDIALHADQVITASDAKIGYPPMRVWGVPAAGLWAHRLGDQRAKRLLFTGDCISGAQAADWGLAVEAPEPADLDERTERLVERIAAMPVNQLIMAKLALNTALLQQGVATSRMVSTVFDGVARHTPEGHAFVAEAREHGFREAVKSRDEPYGDAGRKTSGV